MGSLALFSQGLLSLSIIQQHGARHALLLRENAIQMAILAIQYEAGQLVPMLMGAISVGLGLFAPMNKLRDGTQVIEPKKKLLWRSFFMLLGVLSILFGVIYTR